jgi:hypothetical protein
MNTTVVLNPFNSQQILEYFVGGAKVQLQIPGEVGELFHMGDSLLLNGLYHEAASAFRFRHLMLSSLFPDALEQNTTKSVPMSFQANLAHTEYKLALSQFFAGNVAASYRTLHRHLVRCVRYQQTTGRMLALLMCLECTLGNFPRALQHFDAAQEVYTYTLGPNHPMICMHMNLLSELYHGATWPAQARTMKLLAHVTAQKSLGQTHVITAMLECRLAATLVEEAAYEVATPMLENCVEVFTRANAEGGKFEYELCCSLYNLSVCMIAYAQDIDRAGQLALRCLDLALRVDHRLHNMYPLVVSIYLRLCDLALTKNHGQAAISLLEKAWGVLQKLPPAFMQGHWAGQVMAVFARRSLALLVASMPMNTRSLFDSVAAEWQTLQTHRMAEAAAAARREAQAQQEQGLGQLYHNNRHGAYGSASPNDDITLSSAGHEHEPPLDSNPLHRAILQQAQVWSNACQVVFDAMLKYSPMQYLEMIMNGIRLRELSAAKGAVRFFSMCFCFCVWLLFFCFFLLPSWIQFVHF